MNDNDKNRFAEIMYGFADNFRDEISKDGLRFRFDALKQFSIEQIEQASLKIVKTRKFTKFPAIAEFIQAIEGNAQESIEWKAESQSIKVLDAVKQYGSYNQPKFLDPVTSELISKQFGWGYLCSMDENKKSFFLKEFKSAYLNRAKYSDVSNQIEAPVEMKKLTENIG